MSYYSEIRNKVEDVLNEFCLTFASNPLNFLYESDIQGMLFCKLYDKFADESFYVRIEPNKFQNFKDIDERFINPIKSEYPTGTRFDIAVIDKTKHHQNFWKIPLIIAIEIKFCQFGMSFPDSFGNKRFFYSQKERSLNYDLHKISDYKSKLSTELSSEFCGIGLLFVQQTDLQNSIFMDLKQISDINLLPGISGFIIVPQTDMQPKIYRYDYQNDSGT